MKKKILSLAIIVFVSVMIINATKAWFSDKETSNSNGLLQERWILISMGMILT